MLVRGHSRRVLEHLRLSLTGQVMMRRALAELVGAGLACMLARFLWPEISDAAEVITVPREQEVRVA